MLRKKGDMNIKENHFYKQIHVPYAICNLTDRPTNQVTHILDAHWYEESWPPI